MSCGAAAGLAAAYHAPLAGAVFVAEILIGSLALSQLGPVVVAAVTSYGVAVALGERAALFPRAGPVAIGATQMAPLAALGLAGGLFGAVVLYGLEGARALFRRIALPLPLAFALGGLAVGALSLLRPEVWGNGYSSIEQQLAGPGAWRLVALVLAAKLL